MDAGNNRFIYKGYWIFCALLSLIVLLRCALVPFAHDEVATFIYYIQPGSFFPFFSHVDANGHFLTSATGWISYKLFGSSPFALRLPSLAAFLLLCYAVWQFRRIFKRPVAWAFFAAGLLLSFNLLGFYALCRGYGLSITFLLLAIYSFHKAIHKKDWQPIREFLIYSQLGLAANLTLLPVAGIMTLILIVLKLNKKKWWKSGRIMAMLLHFAFLAFWALYGFYLKDRGALYYGAGDDYWKVTFVSLIDTIAFHSTFVQVMAVAGYILLIAHLVYQVVVYRDGGKEMGESVLTIVTLTILIAGFYLLKNIAGVNYPEDRTALFLYIFYILSLAFVMDESNRIQRLVLWAIPFFLFCHFIVNLNFSVHPWRIYETIPHSFVEEIKAGQVNSKQKVTVGGHRVREFFYGFLNFRSGGELNHCTAPEALQMNCDYAIATAQDSIYYGPYYKEIERDDKWGFRLIGRKKPIERELLLEVSKPAVLIGKQEFFNAVELKDTTLQTVNPLLAEFEMSFESVHSPLNAWLVLEVSSAAEEDQNIFVRVPLNLVKPKWNGVRKIKLALMTGNIPIKIKRLVAYLWNIDKEHLRLSIDSFRLYRLNGEGVTEISKAKI